MLSDSMYLENISEYVEDLNNIVTYKWLSRKLEVPVNAAKQMLYAYLEQNPSIEATYAVSGMVTVDDCKEFQVCIVKQKELESMKEKFEDIFGIHVFSVHQLQIKDPDSLYRANYDTCVEHSDKYSRWSTIECVSGQCSRPPTAPRPEPATPRPEPPKLSITAPVSTSNSSQNRRTNASSGAKKVGAQANKVSSKIKKKNPFFTLIKDNTSKTEPIVKEAQCDDDEAESSNKEEDVELMNMSPVKQEPAKTAVSASAILPCTSIPREQSPNSAPPAPMQGVSLATSAAHKTLEFLGDADMNGGESDEEDPIATTTSTKTERGRKKKSRSQRTEAGGKKEESKNLSKTKALRKRKRVQELSSDEEEVSAGENEKSCNSERKKKRKRTKKLVSKMHINEDGEMVTEKIWESDSTDASEEESASASSHMETVTATSSPMQFQKPKQSSLFRFMKKQ